MGKRVCATGVIELYKGKPARSPIIGPPRQRENVLNGPHGISKKNDERESARRNASDPGVSSGYEREAYQQHAGNHQVQVPFGYVQMFILGLACAETMISPTLKPVAVCSGCGTFANARSVIGRPCGLRVALRQRRCEGVYLVASASDDWVACERCGGKGRGTAGRCSRCQGTGWQYVRASGRRE
jgi:DnaJ-class molecular chaperone